MLAMANVMEYNLLESEFEPQVALLRSLSEW